jgi:hypothetical protein
VNFKEFFLEVFNKSYNFEKGRITNERSYYFITENGDQVDVIFYDDNPRVEIVFRVNDKVDLTGKGKNVFKIFATIAKIIKEDKNYLSKFDYIYFSSKNSEKSRVKLYKTMANEIKKLLNKKYVSESNSSGSSFDNHYFIISNTKDMTFDKMLNDG